MPIAATSASPPPANLDPKSRDSAPKADVVEVAKSFEAVFASLLVKEMRKTLSDGLFGSEQSDVLGALFDLHMGQAMTEGPGLGIQQVLVSQLSPASVPPTQDQLEIATQVHAEGQIR